MAHMRTRRVLDAHGAVEEVTRTITRPLSRRERELQAQKENAAEMIARFKEGLRPGGGAGYLVRIHRFNEQHKEQEYLGTMPLEDWSIDRLMQQHGGGAYTLAVLDDGGKIRTGAARVRIAGPPKGTDGPTPTAGLAGLTEFREFLAEMKGMMTAQQNRGNAVDVGDVAMKLATSIAGVQAATMTAMQAMFNRAPAGDVPARDWKEEMEFVFDLAERLGERGGSQVDPALGMAISTFGRGLERLAEAQAQRGAARPVPRVLPASTTTSSVPTGAPVFDVHKLRPLVTHLIRLAQRDKDPFAHAAAIYDDLRDHPVVIAKLHSCTTAEAREQLAREIVAAFPEIAPHADWFREFCEALFGEVDEDRRQIDEPGPTGDLVPPPAAPGPDTSAGAP